MTDYERDNIVYGTVVLILGVFMFFTGLAADLSNLWVGGLILGLFALVGLGMSFYHHRWPDLKEFLILTWYEANHRVKELDKR